uniref:trypsin n=1 Tax=Anopheles dirus TaxID=7168 RepID=A0A182N1R0_9DIPT
MYLKTATVLFLVYALCEIACTSSIDHMERIIGGTDVKDGAAPYLVALKKNGSFSCDGSIIGARWILTAAHCVIGLTPRNAVILAGTNNLNKGGKEYTVDRVIPYRKYVHSRLGWMDIALIRLKAPVAIGKRINTIKYTTDDVPVNATLTIVGWGYTGPIERTNQSQAINVRKIDLNQCREMYTKYPLQRASIYDGNLCSFTRPGQGVCNGDSGGPVVWNRQLVGVVSWSGGDDPQCAVGYPDVHSRISFFYNWIRKTIAGNSESA